MRQMSLGIRMGGMLLAKESDQRSAHPRSLQTNHMALATNSLRRTGCPSRLDDEAERVARLVRIGEAIQPENSQRVFIACFTRISPAELLSFLTEVAFQLQHGQLIRFGDAHFSEPITFQNNLSLVGTMDTPSFDWWDSDLLLHTTVIQWPQMSVPSCPLPRNIDRLEDRTFLRRYSNFSESSDGQGDHLSCQLLVEAGQWPFPSVSCSQSGNRARPGNRANSVAPRGWRNPTFGNITAAVRDVLIRPFPCSAAFVAAMVSQS